MEREGRYRRSDCQMQAGGPEQRSSKRRDEVLLHGGGISVADDHEEGGYRK